MSIGLVTTAVLAATQCLEIEPGFLKGAVSAPAVVGMVLRHDGTFLVEELEDNRWTMGDWTSSERRDWKWPAVLASVSIREASHDGTLLITRNLEVLRWAEDIEKIGVGKSDADAAAIACGVRGVEGFAYAPRWEVMCVANQLLRRESGGQLSRWDGKFRPVFAKVSMGFSMVANRLLVEATEARAVSELKLPMSIRDDRVFSEQCGSQACWGLTRENELMVLDARRDKGRWVRVGKPVADQVSIRIVTAGDRALVFVYGIGCQPQLLKLQLPPSGTR